MHREQVMMGLMPHLDKASRKKPISELMPLPWEKKGKDAQFGRLHKSIDKKESLAVWDRADGKTNV